MHNGELNKNSWWRDRLVREIALALAVKIVLIFTLWWMFFDLPDSQRINTPEVDSHLVGTSPAADIPKEKLK